MQKTQHKEQNCALLENILIFRGQDYVNSTGMGNKTTVLKALPPSKALLCILIAYRNITTFSNTSYPPYLM